MLRGKWVALIIIFMILACFITFISIPVKSEEEEVVFPLLVVAKKASKETVDLEEWFTVVILIKNIGNDTAYNITLKDTSPPEWSVCIEGSLEARWSKLEPGTAIQYAYNISIKKASTNVISLGRAYVFYQDRSGNKFKVVSEELTVYINIRAKKKIDWGEIWKNLILAEGLLLIGLITPLMYIEVAVYREFKRESEKTGKK